MTDKSFSVAAVYPDGRREILFRGNKEYAKRYADLCRTELAGKAARIEILRDEDIFEVFTTIK